MSSSVVLVLQAASSSGKVAANVNTNAKTRGFDRTEEFLSHGSMVDAICPAQACGAGRGVTSTVAAWGPEATMGGR